MEGYTYKLISIDAIHLQNPFCLRFSLEEAGLQASIKKQGVKLPIFMTEPPDRYIVDGHRRVEASRRLSLKDIPALEIHGDYSKADLFLLAVMANGSQGLSDFEKALVIKKAIEQYQFSKEKIVEEILPPLGLSRERSILEEYLSAASLDTSLFDLLASGKIPFRAAHRLKRFNVKDQKTMAFILTQAGLTTNEFLRISEWLGDLLKPQGKEISVFLDETKLKKILDHPRWDLRCKAEKFYAALRRIRFPHLVECEEKFKSLSAEICEDSSKMKLEAPSYFEEGGFSIRAKVTDPESLEHLLKVLKQKKNSLNSLFDLLL